MTRCQECWKKIRSNTSTEILDGEVLCRRCYWQAMSDRWHEYEDEPFDPDDDLGTPPNDPDTPRDHPSNQPKPGYRPADK